MSTKPARILIVDDHSLFRQGVVQTLDEEGDLNVVAEAGSVKEAIHEAEAHRPDVVLLDLMLPDGNGLEVLRTLRERRQSALVLILTVSDQDDVVLQAIQQGADGYLLKGVSAAELVSAIRGGLAGQATVTPSVAVGLLRRIAEQPAPGSDVTALEELTPRERQILEGIGGGRTNREIAEQLAIHEKTVKHYVTNLFRKLHVRNRVEAALLARRSPEP